MRELIALRAKIDLRMKDIEDQMNECGDPDHRQLLVGACAAYEWVRWMIDARVSEELEEMYAEHIQEEAEADRH